MTTQPIDRSSLVNLSIKRLSGQAKQIDGEIERDVEYIEEKSLLLSECVEESKRRMEEQIGERMNRVDNLRTTQSMIALCLELLEQEQERLKKRGK